MAFSYLLQHNKHSRSWWLKTVIISFGAVNGWDSAGLLSLEVSHEVVVWWQLEQKSYEDNWGHRKAGDLLHVVSGPLDATRPPHLGS